MIEQRVQWIALPARADPGGTLHLSVFVAPRLRTDGHTLAEFLDFLDWPAAIQATQFAVRVGGAVVPATVTGPAPDSTLWKALFGPETPLIPFTFDDYADRPFVTYSVGDVLGTLRKLYASVAAAAPDSLPRVRPRPNVQPPVPGLTDLFEQLRGVMHGELLHGVESDEQRTERVRQLLENARQYAAQRRAPGAVRGGPLVEPLPGDGSVSRHFERALFFHLRPTADPVDMPANGQHYKDTVDFHQMLSALGDHPWLLRRLGLIVDLAVDAASIPMATTAAPGQLSIRPTWASAVGAASADVLLETAYVHQSIDGQTFFIAAPLKPDPAAPPNAPPTGLLPLPATAFTVEQVDVDGSALKAVNLAATLQAIAATDPALDPLHAPEEAGVPALRTSGLALVSAGRAAALQTRFGRHVEINDAVEGAAPHVLYAEDLVRGYRLDVFDAGPGTWRSLHRRVVTATAEHLAAPLPPVDDEGFFQVSLATVPTAPGQPENPNAELYVHETVVTWDGWSLSVPRPGKSISRDPRAPTPGEPATQPTRVPNDPFNAMGLRIETSFAAGSLPRLRFGRGYRVRVRTVDLAGNGPTLAEADYLLASPLTATPALPAAGAAAYLRFEPVAAPVLVPAQRFADGASLQRLAIRSNRDQTPDDYAAEFNASELVTLGRHPPYVGHDDRHVAQPKAAFELVERHGRFDAVVGSDGSPPSAAQQAAIRAAYEIARRERGSFDDPSPSVEFVEIRPDPEHPQRYAVHHEEQLSLPYLPDPLATGALFFGLPGRPAAHGPLHVLFDGPEWYSSRPFRLRLAEGNGAPEWNANQRVLTVQLPKATSATIRVCSLFGGDIGQMGILSWCEQTLGGPDLDRVIDAAKQNRCWLITPWHTIDLVHAVQQPLATPAVEIFEVQRQDGQPFADLYGEVVLDAQSTEKIDVAAVWDETVDDLSRPGPEVRHARAAVFDLSLKVAAQWPATYGPHDAPYTLHDGKLLTFSTTVAREHKLPTPSAHMFGDTHYRHITYEVVATTPFREYFPTDWITQPDLLSRRSAPQVRDVPSSAPPATPRVLYAIPTQGWQATQEGGTTTRRRRGGGLRVYLERGWYSSGDGEMLGVVVGGALTSPSQPDYPYITLLGQDPVRGGDPLEFATPATFRNAALVTGSIQPLEPTDRVRVAAFEPTYDAGTQRWFCDIDLDTRDAYMPFVQLALVRYQAHSLPGCALSRIVLVDIVQTLPDRTLTVVRAPDGAAALQITVVGPTYTAIRGVGAPRTDDAVLARITARIERRDVGIGDDALGWQPVVNAEVTLARALVGVTATWSGRLQVPAADGAPLRLVVIEEDHHAIDEQTPGQAGLGARVIYADRLDL